MRGRRQWIWLGIAAIPPLYVLAKIVGQGVDLPFFDEWFPTSSVDVAIWSRSGTLRISDLLAQNFEHRIVFTHLVTAAGAWLWRGNEKIAMGITWVVALGALATLAGLVRRSFPALWPAALAPISALLFTARAQNNWLWAFESQWSFCIFFLVLGLWWAGRQGPAAAALGGAAVCALCANFSFGSGLLGWGLIAVAMALGGGWRGRHWILWTLLTAAGIALFFRHYQFWPSGDPGRFLHPAAAAHLLRFVVTFLGGWAVPDGAPWLPWGAVCGTATLALFIGTAVFLWRSGERKSIAPWCALGLFPLASALLAGQGWRSDDINNALFGRYVMVSALLPAATAVLVISVLTKTFALSRAARLTVAAPALALFCAAVATSAANWKPALFLATPPMQRCARAFPVTRDLGCIGFALYGADRNREKLDRLAELGLSAFADPVAVEAAQRSAAAPPVELWERELDAWTRPPGLERPGAVTGRYEVPSAAVFVHQGPLRLCLADLLEVTLDIAVSREVRDRMAKLFLELDGESGFSEEHMVFVTLARDEALHRYAFSLEPLISQGRRITGIRVDPVIGGAGPHSWVEVHDLRAVRKAGGTSACVQ